MAPPVAPTTSEPVGSAERPSIETLYRQYARHVASIAFRLLGRDAEVDDLVQDVFVEALRGLSRVRAPDAIKGWLSIVTVRMARKRLRMRRVRGFLGLEHATGYDDVADASASPEERTFLRQLYAALDRVPVEARLAWTLRVLEERELDEVARLCGCSLATVKRRVADAQSRIEREVDDG
jgi:RNA polymerase sigma-70 factor (ECF subfamily)